MAVTKNELLDMLGKSISADLAAEGTPTPQKEPVFSEDFEQRMNEFFAKGSSAKKKNKVRPKRWLIIAIAAVVVLAATACAVPEIRESIAGFFVKVFGNHVEYTDPAITKESIEEEYGLVPIPEGFEETVVLKTDLDLVVDYSDSDGNTITLEQSANKHKISTVDNENGDYKEISVEGKSVLVYLSESYAQASWVDNGYYFHLAYSSSVDINQLCEWISLVCCK